MLAKAFLWVVLSTPLLQASDKEWFCQDVIWRFCHETSTLTTFSALEGKLWKKKVVPFRPGWKILDCYVRPNGHILAALENGQIYINKENPATKNGWEFFSYLKDPGQDLSFLQETYPNPDFIYYVRQFPEKLKVYRASVQGETKEVCECDYSAVPFNPLKGWIIGTKILLSDQKSVFSYNAEKKQETLEKKNKLISNKLKFSTIWSVKPLYNGLGVVAKDLSGNRGLYYIDPFGNGKILQVFNTDQGQDFDYYLRDFFPQEDKIWGLMHLSSTDRRDPQVLLLNLEGKEGDLLQFPTSVPPAFSLPLEFQNLFVQGDGKIIVTSPFGAGKSIRPIAQEGDQEINYQVSNIIPNQSSFLPSIKAQSSKYDCYFIQGSSKKTFVIEIDNCANYHLDSRILKKSILNIIKMSTSLFKKIWNPETREEFLKTLPEAKKFFNLPQSQWIILFPLGIVECIEPEIWNQFSGWFLFYNSEKNSLKKINNFWKESDVLFSNAKQVTFLQDQSQESQEVWNTLSGLLRSKAESLEMQSLEQVENLYKKRYLFKKIAEKKQEEKKSIEISLPQDSLISQHHWKPDSNNLKIEEFFASNQFQQLKNEKIEERDHPILVSEEVQILTDPNGALQEIKEIVPYFLSEADPKDEKSKENGLVLVPEGQLKSQHNSDKEDL